jgi:hypothetical protein
MSQFWKENTDLIHTGIDEDVSSTPHDISEASAKYFQSVYISYCFGIFFYFNQCTETLSLVPTLNSNFQNATKPSRPSKSVGLDGLHNFHVNSCSEIFVPLLRFIFNLFPSQNNFLNLCKQAAIVLV